MQKTQVSTASLKSLLQWCEDAIDFHDESDDSWVHSAFDTLTSELETSKPVSS